MTNEINASARDLLKRLMVKIKVEAKKKKLTIEKIAQAMSLSNGTVSNYLNVKHKIPFNRYIELLNIVMQDKVQIDHFIDEYLNKMDNMEFIKEAVEWFFVNGEGSRAASLIKKYKDEDSIFVLYELLLKRNNRSINKNDFLREVEKTREKGVKDLGTKVLCRIANIYAHLDFKAFPIMEFLADEATILNKDLGESFLQISYQLRLNEMSAIASLMRNDPQKSEEIVLQAINDIDENVFPIPVSSLYSLLSEVYLFKDFKKSLEYNRKAFSIFTKSVYDNPHRKAILESTHDFIKIHHGDFSGLFLSDSSEVAHYYAKVGGAENVKKALSILEDIETKKELSPFQIYYKALALRDLDLLDKSQEAFISNGNLYYSQIPKTAKKSLFP